MIDNRKLVLSSLVSATAYLVIGYVFYFVIFADFFRQNTGSAVGVFRSSPVVWAVLLAQLSLGTLTALACAYTPRVSGFGTGLKAGAWIGLLLGMAMALDSYAVTHIHNLTAALVDTMLWIVRGSIAGGFAAWMLDREAD